MADTTFTNGVTLTDADWFNDLNRLHYTILLDPADLAAVISNLHIPTTGNANVGLSASVGSNALTISLKGRDGNDPSATNPVVIAFRSATAATGTQTVLSVTSATSLVVTAGSTLGTVSGAAAKLWVVGFNDAGTFRLGVVNCLSGTSIMALRDDIIASSTAEGGSGGADSAQVIYTGTAVTSKAMRVLGYIEITEATAGTWATAHTKAQAFGPGVSLPGTVIQSQVSQTGAVATGTTTIPSDDSIPQSGEGDQYMSQAITPTSAANVLRIISIWNGDNSASVRLTAALFQDSGSDALAAAEMDNNTANGERRIPIDYEMRAGTTSATTFKIRAGGSGAGTTTFNGVGSVRKFGGVMNSFLKVQEVMA